MATAYTMNDELVPAKSEAKKASPSQRPPVIILNMFYSGLGIARDLAGEKIRVLGLSADPKIYGNSTRCCEVRMAPNSQEEPEQLAETLLRLSPEFSGAVIFPTRDADVFFLDRFREELGQHYRLAIPPHDVLMRVNNKHALAMAAHEAGVPVPRTALLSSVEDRAGIPQEIGFPCVLKPVMAARWRRRDSWIKVGARKAVRVDDPQSLQRECELLSAVDTQILAQEWIAGSADKIVVLGGYVRPGGDLVSYFTARKLVQSPDDFGTGCLVESDEIPEIVELSQRLFKDLSYEGMAEVEFKYDDTSGQYQLIEINSRHWDWHRLGVASGINLSWIAYLGLIGDSSEPRQNRIVRARWIAEDALLVYLIRALYHRRVRLRDVMSKLSGPRVYAVASWSDPRPWWRYFFLEFLPGLARACFQSLQGGAS